MSKPKSTMTQRAIARMLTEPTGTHFLDSGGAYGRHWQRQQGTGVQAYIQAPPITVEAYGGSDGERDVSDGNITLDLFHYLTSKLEYCHGLTMGLLSFGRSKNRQDELWLSTIDAYVARRVTGEVDGDAKQHLADHYFGVQGANSYNDENLLSQTIQFTVWWDEQTYSYLVALQVHGGCDARGGYTVPKIFQLMTDDPWDFFDWRSYSVVCTALGSEDQVLAARMAETVEWQKGCQRALVGMLPGMPYTPPPAWEREPWADIHYWDTRSGEWSHYGGNFVGDPWEQNDRPKYRMGVNDAGERDSSLDIVLCPECGAPADVYAR